MASEPQWVEVHSPNFSVVTDAGKKRGREVALHFEQMRSVFGTLMAKTKINLAVPLQIVACRNSKEMRQVAPLFNGEPTDVAGVFQAGQDRSFIILDMSVANPWSVVFHEYAHQLMDGNLPFRTDPWFEEGFAEYFAAIEMDDKEALVGRIPAETYRILQSAVWMKLPDLFRVEHYSRTYNETGDHRTAFYAESSLVVHYLNDNNLMSKMPVYFGALKVQKKTVEQSILAAFGMTAIQLDVAVREYMGTGHSDRHRLAAPATIVPSRFGITAMSAGDVRALMADIHVHSLDYRDRALDEFQEVLRTDANNEPALRGAGFALLQKSDYEHAAEYLRRAAELNSRDARVHLYYAVLLNEEGIQNEEDVTKIKNELKTAIVLDPTLADAYSLLGFTQAFSGEAVLAIASLKKALEFAPRNERYLFNLANAYTADHDYDEAISIFRSLAQNENARVAAQASHALEQAVNVKKQRETLDSDVADGREDSLHRALRIGQQGIERSEVRLSQATPMRFLRGELITVDCSAAPHAVITVVSGSESVRVHIQDSARLVLIGADNFSCAWRNMKVAVNYRDRDDGDGDAVSLEMQ
jgi:tetratricopeptide (TPR) repeat protein